MAIQCRSSQESASIMACAHGPPPQLTSGWTSCRSPPCAETMHLHTQSTSGQRYETSTIANPACISCCYVGGWTFALPDMTCVLKRHARMLACAIRIFLVGAEFRELTVKACSVVVQQTFKVVQLCIVEACYLRPKSTNLPPRWRTARKYLALSELGSSRCASGLVIDRVLKASQCNSFCAGALSQQCVVQDVPL